MELFKLRASATNKVIGVKGLIAGHKAYSQEWLKERLYSRRKSFTSKYTDKGNENEREAIDYAGGVLNWEFAVKNEAHFNNDFFTGTPDVILEDKVIDIKCSWDCFTFPMFDDKPPLNYSDQLQIYMDLTGKRSAQLVFVLTDTPTEQIEKEFRYSGLGDEDYEKFREQFFYSGLPSELRIKSFDIEYDADRVKLLQGCVTSCREYIKAIQK